MHNLPVLEPVAVTGATGFIGTHLVRALTSAGYRPTLLTHSGNTRNRLLEMGELTTQEVDLADRASIQNAINKVKPATIFHLAGTRGRGDSRVAAAACEELNYRATSLLLEAAMNAGAKRIVIVGSAEEYGDQPGPQRESLPLNPVSAYGISKAKATEYALTMHAESGCPVVIVRPFSVYGPGQPGHMFIAEAVDSAVRNLEFEMSRGEQKRDLIFVEDVVNGLMSAANASGIDGHVINLGSGECHRLRDVAQLIRKLTGARAPLLIGARSASDAEIYDTWADVSLARCLLDWEPRVDLETGLQRTIDFAREQLATKAQACQVT